MHWRSAQYGSPCGTSVRTPITSGLIFGGLLGGALCLYCGGLEQFPGGSSCNARRSASSPQARESDPNREAPKSSTSLMAEDGGIKPHPASTGLTVSKAVSTLNGLRLPYQSACASFAKAQVKPWRPGRESNPRWLAANELP